MLDRICGRPNFCSNKEPRTSVSKKVSSEIFDFCLLQYVVSRQILKKKNIPFTFFPHENTTRHLYIHYCRCKANLKAPSSVSHHQAPAVDVTIVDCNFSSRLNIFTLLHKQTSIGSSFSLVFSLFVIGASSFQT